MFIPAIAGVDMFGCRLSTCQRLKAAAQGMASLVGALDGAAGMGSLGATGSEPFMPLFGGGGGCFVAGTPISVGDETTLDNHKSSDEAKAHPAASRKSLDPTQDGLPTKRIETVQASDTVASRNPVTGRTEFKKVARTFKHTVYETVTLELADARTGTVVQSLCGTPEHPFFTPGGMVAMGEIRPEMTVISRRGPPLVVKSATREYHPAGIAVYNFEVEDDHAYFVGTAQGGAWVHNIGDCLPSYANPGDIVTESEEEALREAARLHGINEPFAIERKPMYGNNPNLVGPKGEPWETVDITDGTNFATIQHHSNGHRFGDVNPPRIVPGHYHGPGGHPHIYYP